MHQPRKRSAVLFLTHFFDGVILSEYRKLTGEVGHVADVFLVVNAGRGFDARRVPEDVRMLLLQGQDFDHVPYARSKRGLNSFNVELFALLFRERMPAYDHLWVMEYDVRFSGNWLNLFGPMMQSGADLLGTTICRYLDSPGWENWASMTAPVALTDHQKIRGFFPFYRISSAGLAALDTAYRAGWSGHFECTMPTILGHAGLEIEDIGGSGEFVRPGNEQRFYRNDPLNADLGPGTFIFRPVRPQPGDEADKLWHPVKPDASYGWATGRRAKLVKAARMLLSIRGAS